MIARQPGAVPSVLWQPKSLWTLVRRQLLTQARGILMAGWHMGTIATIPGRSESCLTAGHVTNVFIRGIARTAATPVPGATSIHTDGARVPAVCITPQCRMIQMEATSQTLMVLRRPMEPEVEMAASLPHHLSLTHRNLTTSHRPDAKNEQCIYTM